MSTAIHPQLARKQWASASVRERLRIIRRLRVLIADNADSLGACVAAVSDRPIAEKLVSEVLPLADACRWLERNAARVLAPRRHGRRSRPLWLRGVDFEVQRRPFGDVLVIGPGNYPLLLPAIHALHALVAGNAVRLKPAPGTRHVALAFARLASEAGLNPALIEILDDTDDAAREAIADGADKVIFTGSSGNGRDVLAQLAKTNTPSVMELSGEDPVVVLQDADLDLVVRALSFGTRLNAGQTCIAPRRIIAVEPVAEALANHPGSACTPRARLGALAGPPNPAGAAALFPRMSASRKWEMPPARERAAGSGARALPIEIARDEDHAVELANSAESALGASLFTRDPVRARKLAARIHTGFVTINDIIVPTADPRMPFGGVKASGFGTTRGAEGLLEMTFPHVIAIRHGGSHLHFNEPSADDARLFSAWLRVSHGRHRLRAIPELFRALLAKIKTTKTRP